MSSRSAKRYRISDLTKERLVRERSHLKGGVKCRRCNGSGRVFVQDREAKEHWLNYDVQRGRKGFWGNCPDCLTGRKVYKP